MNLVNIPSVEFEQGTNGAYALQYASLGWHVIPLWWIQDGQCACGKDDCKTPGKHPLGRLAPFGQKSATYEARTIARWWKAEPNANIGIYLAPSGLCAIDIDPRNGGIETIDQLEAQHGPIVSDLLQYTGGGGEHRIFERPTGNMPGKLGPGVDFKLDGYIVVEPSNHLSGKRYEFEASSSPLDGCVASPLPDWLRDLAQSAQHRANIPPAETPTPIEQQRLDDLTSALPYILNPDRDTWLRVGFAIHNEIGGQVGFDLWDGWAAKNGSPYDPSDQIRVWRSFKRRGIDGVTLASVFQLAMDEGWINAPEPSVSPAETIAAFIAKIKESAALPKENVKPKTGQWRIPVPALQEVADWFSTLSETPHPMISVVGALAFGSVVAGRRYRSTNANWTAMQYVLAAPSGVGKNYIKSGINRLLLAADMHDFFGSSFYTHSAAVYWALNTKPTHICVSDEFGDSMAEARLSENSNKASVFKALKFVYSDCDDAYIPEAYSMSGLSKRDREERKNPPVIRPSLTLLGLTTPMQFYGEVKTRHIEGGTMNRFVVFNLDKDGCKKRQRMGDGIPPENLIDYIKSVRQLGELPRDFAPDVIPTFITVPFTNEASQVFDRFKEEEEEAGDALEQTGMGNMPRRWRENAMRIATMLAAWDNPSDPIITEELADWSCRLVRHFGEETIKQLIGKVSDSDYGHSSNMVLSTIKDYGPGNWISRTELCRRHRGIKARDMADILSHLVDMELVLSQRENGKESGGRPAFVFTYAGKE